LSHLPSLALAISIPPVVWRAETGFRHDSQRTAADVIRYEQETRGHALDLDAAHLRDLDRHSADALLWVTFTHENALRYGSAADVNELRLDIPATVIATDGEGGFLLFFSDDLTQPTGAAAMADQFEHDPAARDPRDVIDNAEQQQKAQQEPAPAARAPEIDAEEEKRRAGRGGGDMGNPTHAQLGANIRPEVGSGPAGLETYTTQKSVDYHAVDPKTEKVSDYIRARLAEAERSINQPTLTLEAIAADPHNAVELPLPADASKELLTAARDAVLKDADYLANWTGNFTDDDPAIRDESTKVADRLELLDERLDQFAELDPATREANAASIKRQEAERAAQSGESVPGEEGASQASDYIAERLAALREAKAEREGEGAELAVVEHGEGKTPGGGGRGIF